MPGISDGNTVRLQSTPNLNAVNQPHTLTVACAFLSSLKHAHTKWEHTHADGHTHSHDVEEQLYTRDSGHPDARMRLGDGWLLY